MCRTPAASAASAIALRLGVIHGERFFAEHVLARARWPRCAIGACAMFGVAMITACTSSRLHDLLVVRGGDGDPRFAAGLFERRGIRVAERDDLRIRAKREAGEMILQRDAAAADDGDAKRGIGHG